VIDGDIDSDLVQEAIGRLAASLQSDPGFGPSTVTRNQSGDLALLAAPLSGGHRPKRASVLCDVCATYTFPVPSRASRPTWS
jgi:hypothetical protein